MSNPERVILDRALRALAGCTRRLELSRSRLAGLLPLTAERLAKLSADEEEALDALLKRFEQTVATMQDQVVKGIGIVEGEDVAGMSRRDLSERMERLGALPSAQVFRELVVLRNRLAHLYPDDPARQVAILNAVHARLADTLAAAASLGAYATRRSGTPPTHRA